MGRVGGGLCWAVLWIEWEEAVSSHEVTRGLFSNLLCNFSAFCLCEASDRVFSLGQQLEGGNCIMPIWPVSYLSFLFRTGAAGKMVKIPEIPPHNGGNRRQGCVFSLEKRLLRRLGSSLQLFKELFCVLLRAGPAWRKVTGIEILIGRSLRWRHWTPA